MIKLDAEKVYAVLSSPDGISENGLKIKGIALTAGEHNDVLYTGEEMMKAADSLIGCKVRLDHKKEVQALVGKIDNAEYKEENGKQFIEFEATIMDGEIANKIRQGLIDRFSVGVDVDIERQGTTLIARDMQFKELSLVTDPADENAMLIEILNNKLSKRDLNNILKEVDKMVEKKLAAEVPKGTSTNEPDTLKPVTKKDEEPVAETATKPKAELQDEGEMSVDDLKAENEELKKTIANLQAENAALKKQIEENKTTETTEEPQVPPQEKQVENPEVQKKIEQMSKKINELEELLEKGSRKTVVNKKETEGRMELMYNPYTGYTKKNPFGKVNNI